MKVRGPLFTPGELRGKGKPPPKLPRGRSREDRSRTIKLLLRGGLSSRRIAALFGIASSRVRALGKLPDAPQPSWASRRGVRPLAPPPQNC